MHSVSKRALLIINTNIKRSTEIKTLIEADNFISDYEKLN